MGAKSVIAVLGQSNALGFGQGWKPLTSDRPNFRVSQYAVFGPARRVTFPFTEPALGPRPKVRAVGAAATFAKALVRATGGRAMLVPGHGEPCSDQFVKTMFNTMSTAVRQAT